MPTKTSIITSVVVLAAIIGGVYFFWGKSAAAPVVTTPSPTFSPVASSTPTATTSPVFVSGKSYTVRIGESLTLLGATATVLSVTEDSRCPANVNCIQAGSVKVSVRIAMGVFSTVRTLTLGTPISGAGYSGVLVSVTPQKFAGKTIAPADYRFTFKVTKI